VWPERQPRHLPPGPSASVLRRGMRAPGINFVRGEWKPSKPTSSESPTSPSLGVPFAPCSATEPLNALASRSCRFFADSNVRHHGSDGLEQRPRGPTDAQRQKAAAASSNAAAKQQSPCRNTPNRQQRLPGSSCRAAAGKAQSRLVRVPSGPHQNPITIRTRVHRSKSTTLPNIPPASLSPGAPSLPRRPSPDCRVSCPVRSCPLLGSRLPHSRRGGPHIE